MACIKFCKLKHESVQTPLLINDDVNRDIRKKTDFTITQVPRLNCCESVTEALEDIRSNFSLTFSSTITRVPAFNFYQEAVRQINVEVMDAFKKITCNINDCCQETTQAIVALVNQTFTNLILFLNNTEFDFNTFVIPEANRLLDEFKINLRFILKIYLTKCKC